MVKEDRGLDNPKVSSQAVVPSRGGATPNMAANIKVVVRVRPLNEKEKTQNNCNAIDVVDDKMLVFDPKEETRPFFYQGVQQPTKNYLKRSNKELKFVFDQVCGFNSTNQDIFETATKDIVASLMEGYNCSVFAYGATGAGKTYTMIGNKKHPGITYLTMDHLFDTISGLEMERKFDIGVSYIEVYNENVYDLLKPSSTPLQLREDAKYGVVVAGLTLNKIKTARELLDMLENGNKNRTQHPTDANAESSRSHAVFQVYVKMRYKTSSQCRLVKLSMIDLAGSERASATGCVGERFKEGANINRSLLSLGNCINKLADGSAYIPYRDSKLTRLLKDSLGGNCKTVMIANVSPSSLCYDDTYNTLKYAARANKIQLSIKKNIVNGDMRLSQYVKMNQELARKIEELEKKNKELQAQLTLSSLEVVKEPNNVADKAKQNTWIERVNEAELTHGPLENKLLTLMSQQRVLALRHFLRTRAFAHVADLAYRSSSEALEQICTEEIPRQERAAENYVKQHENWKSRITTVWSKWDVSRKRLQTLHNDCISECPDLKHFIDTLKLKSKSRLLEARNNLHHKIKSIMKEEITVSTECISDAFGMLKKVYLTLKGYGLAPPSLTAEYLEIVNKAKSAKVITWYDENSEVDQNFVSISDLDLDNPIAPIDFDTQDDNNGLANIENCDPELSTNGVKRKGTPIKLANNETIVINDSFEEIDTMNNLNSAKKVKVDYSDMDVENLGVIDPKDLNSTFVLAGKTDALKTMPLKFETKDVQPVKKGLYDRSNTVTRTINFNNDNKARVVKPVVPFRRVVAPPPTARGPAFGSGVARDGSSLQRPVQGGFKKATLIEKSVGFKAVRARDRVQAHPYSRPALNGRK